MSIPGKHPDEMSPEEQIAYMNIPGTHRGIFMYLKDRGKNWKVKTHAMELLQNSIAQMRAQC